MIASLEPNPALATEPTVFVVDDDDSIRESLELLILESGWRPRLFASAPEFLAHPPTEAPQCLILDMSLPGLSGLELQQRIAADRPHTPIIFITGGRDVPKTVAAMKAGAFEFLTKPFGTDILLQAIRQALHRSRATLSRRAAIRAVNEAYATLTIREREVMSGVVAGRLNKQIAGELGISIITVKAHRGNVMRKMGAKTLADLIRMSDRLGPYTQV